MPNKRNRAGLRFGTRTGDAGQYQYCSGWTIWQSCMHFICVPVNIEPIHGPLDRFRRCRFTHPLGSRRRLHCSQPPASAPKSRYSALVPAVDHRSRPQKALELRYVCYLVSSLLLAHKPMAACLNHHRLHRRNSSSLHPPAKPCSVSSTTASSVTKNGHLSWRCSVGAAHRFRSSCPVRASQHPQSTYRSSIST